jgi:hypothetical protein
MLCKINAVMRNDELLIVVLYGSINYISEYPVFVLVLCNPVSSRIQGILIRLLTPGILSGILPNILNQVAISV